MRNATKQAAMTARAHDSRESFARGVIRQATSGITLWTKVEGLERDARLQVEISPARLSAA